MENESGFAQRLADKARAGVGVLRTSFLWGFIEATLFFIVADVAVGWVALHANAKRTTQAALLALAGATLGGLFIFFAPAFFAAAIPNVPGVGDGQIAFANEQVAEHGWRALLTVAWTGLPYKVVATSFVATSPPFLLFVGLTLAARALRFGPVAAVFYVIGRLLRGTIDARPRLTLTAYATFWVALYAYFFLVVVPSF